MINKNDIITAVAKKTELNKKITETTINAFLQEIVDQVKMDGKVQIMGFGTFELRERKARDGRNPKTGEAVKVKASKGIGFKVGKQFKENIN